MATRKRWSSSVGSQRGARVRVFERTPGGPLYCAVWVPGRGVSRRSLGHTDRTRALREAKELATLRATGETTDITPVTLGALCARYLAEMTHARDGSLKTEHYRRDCAKRAEHLYKWFGASCEATQLTPDRMQAYVAARRAGKVTGRPVRTRSVQCDLAFLKTVLRWATGVFENGQPLLDRNPLAAFSPPHERDPRRPILDGGSVTKLLGVAAKVHAQLPLLIVLMDTTGRRLSSVLGLRWDDFDFERQTIRWRAELDKTRRAWQTPIPRAALAPLLASRRVRPAIGSALVFPHPTRSKAGLPVTRHLASYWLKQAFELAGVAKPEGSLFHAFRRRWATTRKHLPLTDVAAAGGWRDLTTLLTCYQQPDEETLREVVDYEKPAATGTRN
jgi:integrase